jgi:hypothetical protein
LAEDALGDEPAHRLESAVGRRLPVLLHQPRRESRRVAAVNEASARERRAHRVELLGGEHISDHDLHA